MAKARSIHVCVECGAQHARWLGRCPACRAWDSLVEEAAPGSEPPALIGSAPTEAADASGAVLLGKIDALRTPHRATGIDEVDRVLGGGLVPGSVVLLGGEPGIGKSTLCLQLAARLQDRDGGVLYVSGEESPEQIRLRADRLHAGAAGGPTADRVRLLSETRVEGLSGPWQAQQPALVLVDSIQTLRSERIESAPGSVSQVRECAALLATAARASGAALVLVGHVTKEGALAGPRVLEHLVDVVLSFEGDRHHAFRLLRASKNRFGATSEVGVFRMAAEGLAPVANPSELFLPEDDERSRAPGSCVVPLLEGTRPFLVELQALVAPAPYGTPRRTTLGIEDGRLALLLAVLDRHTDLDVLSRDVYANAAGGVRIGEPGADLPLALALASSRLDVALPPDVAACGELGLGGEVRRVPRLEERAREAARLGFRTLLAPRGAARAAAGSGLAIIEIPDAAAAVAWVRACTGA